jgi:MoaA/NifB/PqqE/SkfB family radical SAM enzyme
MKDTFCQIPWVGLTSNSLGQPIVCCQASADGTGDRYVDDQGRPLNTKDHSFDEIRNSPLFRKVRRELLEGGKPKVCQKCWKDEAAGIASLRQVRGNSVRFNEADARAVTDEHGAIDTVRIPFVPELRLSNVCNLSCRMCSPTYSNSWHGDALAFGNGARGVAEDYGLSVHGSDRTLKIDSDRFWESIETSLPTLRKIIFTGGEPFLQSGHYRLLDLLVAKGCARNVRLSYTTNLTLLPDKLVALWEQFEGVHVGVSIEGVGPAQEYIRHPANWPKIEENLRTLDRLAGVRRWSTLIQVTISVYNVLYVDELVQWFLGEGLSSIHNLEFRRLDRPEYLNVRALPENAKQAARKSVLTAIARIEAALGSIQENERARFLRNAVQTLHGVVEYMESGTLTGEWPRFKTFTAELDRIRGQSVRASLPALGSFL